MTIMKNESENDKDIARIWKKRGQPLSKSDLATLLNVSVKYINRNLNSPKILSELNQKYRYGKHDKILPAELIRDKFYPEWKFNIRPEE